MDNETAKQILSAYRSNLDNDNAVFKEALDHCRDNPEMKAWLQEEQAQDARMTDALQSMKAPPTGKEAILATAFLDEKETSERPSTTKSRLNRIWAIGAMAAAIPLAVLTWLAFTSSSGDSTVSALVELNHSIQNLDLVDASVPTLAAWLHEQGAPSIDGLPDSLRDQKAVGCTVLKDSASNPVSIICLNVEGALVHVFIMNQASPLIDKLPKGQWIAADGLNLYAWSRDDLAYAIATELDPAAIDRALGASLHQVAS